MQSDNAFGTWVRRRRETLDFTRKELAQRIGCAEETIRKIEVGTRQPSKQLVELLAHHLEVSDDEQSAFLKSARLPQKRIERYRLHSLPSPLSSLIGREAELITLHKWLIEDRTRLITLTGAPGVGKTRLSIEAAHSVEDTYLDRALFIELGPLLHHDQVIPTIAHALGVQESTTQSLIEGLKFSLRGQGLLLVLDNFEHVVGAAMRIVELLEAMSQVKILVTSRVSLHVRGERLFPVAPLALPRMAASIASNGGINVLNYPAPQLFVERVQWIRPDYVPTEQDTSAINEICRHLDGLPLAIEQIAARANLLTMHDILQWVRAGSLQEGIGMTIPTPAQADLPERQRTLHAAIDWSYCLLSEPEQRVLRRLSAFVGGFTSGAVEVVGTLSSDAYPDASGLQDNTVPALLAQLTDKSLVVVDHFDDQTRFRLLEPIRQFAHQKLIEAGEEESTRHRQLAYFTRLAEEAGPHLRRAGPDRKLWCDRIEADLDNFRAALDHTVQTHGTATSERIINGLRYFWKWRIYAAEGIGWINSLLMHNSSPGQRAYVLGRISAGFLSTRTGDFAQAEIWLAEALPMAHMLGDEELTLDATAGLGFTTTDYERAVQLETEAIRLADKLGDLEVKADCLYSLGRRMNLHGDREQAIGLLENGLQVARACRDDVSAAWCLCELGIVAFQQGDYTKAQVALEESIASAQSEGEPITSANCQLELARVALRQQRLEEAVRLLKQCIVIFQRVGNVDRVADCLSVSAGVAQERGEHERAVRWLGVAAVVRRDFNRHTILKQRIYAEYEFRLAALHEVVVEIDFERSWAEGERMPLAQAVGELLAISECYANTCCDANRSDRV